MHPPHACSFVCAVTLGAANAASWLLSTDVGAIATGITIVALAIVGVTARAIKEVQRARAEAWADRQRLEMQVQADRDRLESESLSAQLTKVRLSLHELRNQANVDTLHHREEAERLTRQLGDTARELHEAREEIRRLREENARILARLAEQQRVQGRQIAENTRAIEDVAGKSGVIAVVKVLEPPTNDGPKPTPGPGG